jgi:hypothetical protein
MADSVIEFSRLHNVPVRGGLPRGLRRFCGDEYLNARLIAETKFHRKLGVILRSSWSDPNLAMAFLRNKFRTRFLGERMDLENEVRKELSRLSLDTLILAK